MQFIRYSRRFFPLLSPIFWRHSRGITTAIRKMFTLLSYLAKVFFCVCLYVMFLERCESRSREDKVASPPRQDMHIRKRWNKRESKVKSVAVARTCLTTRDSHLLDVLLSIAAGCRSCNSLKNFVTKFLQAFVFLFDGNLVKAMHWFAYVFFI